MSITLVTGGYTQANKNRSDVVNEFEVFVM
jgi:hypothetical protein